MRISSSWRPSLFFCGHLPSSSLVQRPGSAGGGKEKKKRKRKKAKESDRREVRGILHDLGFFDDAFDLLDHQAADTHWGLSRLARAIDDHERIGRSVYSLCGSVSRYGSWSCWHSAPWHCDRQRERGSRILMGRGRRRTGELARRTIQFDPMIARGGGDGGEGRLTQELVAETSVMA